MNTFSERSLCELSSCHPDLVKLFTAVVKKYDCSIICGHRGKAAQDLAVIEGKSDKKWPTSKHNIYPSMAVDVVPYHKESLHIRWEDAGAFYMFSGYVMRMAEEMGINIRYGGDWDGDRITKDQNFNDLPHWELIQAK